MTRAGVALLILALSRTGPALAEDAAPPDSRTVAERFGKLFVEGRHQEARDLLSPEMRAAMTPDQAAQLLAGLEAEHGAVRTAGPLRLEDPVQTYQRFRLPVTFEKGALDLRIVVDAEHQVAGLFVVPQASAVEERVVVDPPVPEREVAIDGPLGRLPGTLTVPQGKGPLPAVVLVHGSGPSDRDGTLGPNKPLRDLAWGLAGQGIAVLRYDKRSYVAKDTLLPLGDKLTVRHEAIDDARAALALVRRTAGLDPARVFVLGHSLGGAIVPRIAAGAPPPAGMIVLAGPTRPLPETLVRQLRYIAGTDGSISPAEQASLAPLESQMTALRAALDGLAPPPAGYVVGAPFGYYRDLEEHDPPAEAAAVGLPILVLQGGRDYQVTLEDFGRWKAALAGRPAACCVTYEALDHLFREGRGPSTPADYERAGFVDPGVIRDIALWILEGRCASVPVGPVAPVAPVDPLQVE